MDELPNDMQEGTVVVFTKKSEVATFRLTNPSSREDCSGFCKRCSWWSLAVSEQYLATECRYLINNGEATDYDAPAHEYCGNEVDEIMQNLLKDNWMRKEIKTDN